MHCFSNGFSEVPCVKHALIKLLILSIAIPQAKKPPMHMLPWLLHHLDCIRIFKTTQYARMPLILLSPSFNRRATGSRIKILTIYENNSVFIHFQNSVGFESG